MKKKSLINLSLNKKVISNLNNSQTRGGKPPATQGPPCVPETQTCETACLLNTCYFSCPGHTAPSCNYTDCNQGN